MIRTRVGYAGGTTRDPNYGSIGNHSETVQVDYDPTVVSYEQLIEAFWNGHYPVYPSYSVQYRSAIFYSTTGQKKIAEESRKKEENQLGQTIYTDIEELGRFYIAEDYHQKYYLQGNADLMTEIAAIYPDPVEFVNSTAAARLNGYLAGYGDDITLRENLGKLGLSESGQRRLLEITSFGLNPACPVR